MAHQNLDRLPTWRDEIADFLSRLEEFELGDDRPISLLDSLASLRELHERLARLREDHLRRRSTLGPLVGEGT